MMKRLYFLFGLSAALFSCSLKEDSSLYLAPDDFCATVEQCDACVKSVYNPFNSIYQLGFEIALEGCTDLYYIDSGTQDAQMDISPANARFGTTVWEYAYYGVRNANYAIYAMEKSPLDPAVTKPLIAEAKIMRAWWYYLLTSFFGDVPFYTNYLKNVQELEAVRTLPRMSATETRAALVEELQECIGDLPQQRRCDLGLQRAGAAMGYMVLAKLAMWNKDWVSATKALETLESLYGPLSRYPLSDVPYSVKNTDESIYEIQHEYSTTGLKFYSNLGCITVPCAKGTNADGKTTFDGVEIPELGKDCVVWQSLRPNGFLANGLFTRTSTDKRKDMTLVWSWNGKNFSRVWSGPKLWCYNMYSTCDSNNYTILRYADAVLMLAECYNELNEHEKAIQHLNQVKERAGISPYGTFKTKEKLLDEIQNERGRELAGEFQRKFDLVRWGIWYQRTYEFSEYQKLKDNIRPCMEYYPIPDVQCALSGGALDNKAYEEGL